MKISDYTPRVGDRVRVVGDSNCLSDYTGTVTRVFHNLSQLPFVVHEENGWNHWTNLDNTGEIYLMEKTLDNLEVGDVVVCDGDMERTILGISGSVCHLSGVTNSKRYATTYGIEDLKGLGYTIKKEPSQIDHNKEEWLKKGEESGWVKKGKVVE